MKILILLAGGVGKRTGLGYPKQFHKIKGKTLLNHLIDRNRSHVDKIVLVLDKKFWGDYNLDSVTLVENGSERIFSIQNALKSANVEEGDIVHIHDAARVLLSPNELAKNEAILSLGRAIISSAESFDTMFVIDDNSEIKKIYAKKDIVRGMTPQTYTGSDLIKNMNEIFSVRSEKDLTEIMNLSFFASLQVDNLRKVTSSDDIKWIEGEI